MAAIPSQAMCKQAAEGTPVGGFEAEEPSLRDSDCAFSTSSPLLHSLLSLSRVSSSVGDFNVSVPSASA